MRNETGSIEGTDLISKMWLSMAWAAGTVRTAHADGDTPATPKRDAWRPGLVGVSLQKFKHDHAGHRHVQPDRESDACEAVRLEPTAEREQ